MTFRQQSFLALILVLTASAAHAAEPALPAPLELKYILRYGGIEVGHATRTLVRESDGTYTHRSRSVPEGPMRIFTKVEWFEEGRFEIVSGKVRPLNFLEYRVGADKPHRHSATFDWSSRKIHYAGWPDAPLAPGTQDQGSIVYAWMLNPPAGGSEQRLFVSTGKKLREYRYLEVGSENIKTIYGTIRTRIIERRPLAKDKDQEVFRVWLAPDRHNVPVRISTQTRGQDTILELVAVSGDLAPASPSPSPVKH